MLHCVFSVGNGCFQLWGNEQIDEKQLKWIQHSLTLRIFLHKTEIDNDALISFLIQDAFRRRLWLLLDNFFFPL